MIKNEGTLTNEMIGTTKRSIEAIPSRLRRNGSSLAMEDASGRAMCFATEVRPTSMPSLRSSRWMRGAPREDWKADLPD